MSDVLERLEAVIAERRRALSADPELGARSYVARALGRGVPRLATKLGEEAAETMVAALAEDDGRLAAEAADLLFHLLLLLAGRGVPLAAVWAELERREGQSGLRRGTSA
ncbi:MAG: phosphoribosyl-ATP diphosphatase [Sphingomonadaceae bacterium]|uniref:phosphoribosyl-ATP diphosphatase n=1 Tax=Thermaurantiacus sp. TaxID=2820283 RepID=UPI00298EF7A8|nr:phosphoribosyl-ATP diphosphatase [Thermaurantiacus sp.]MCS6986566.1 phosphoribosyl-ATP diphosphatase [Sphingomonadaceae bacterium]MDW8414173.1 phosphoribosyl-ATP diphosphatase [Thermaurantiacus sp.]